MCEPTEAVNFPRHVPPEILLIVCSMKLLVPLTAMFFGTPSSRLECSPNKRRINK
jgi:hypothetical protein